MAALQSFITLELPLRAAVKITHKHEFPLSLCASCPPFFQHSTLVYGYSAQLPVFRLAVVTQAYRLRSYGTLLFIMPWGLRAFCGRWRIRTACSPRLFVAARMSTYSKLPACPFVSGFFLPCSLWFRHKVLFISTASSRILPAQ
jgi:hypothetical protein